MIEDEKSIFNKGSIAVKLTDSGHVSLTNTSLTEIIYGEKVSVKLQGINIENYYIHFLILNYEKVNSRLLFGIGYFVISSQVDSVLNLKFDFLNRYNTLEQYKKYIK